MSEHERSLAEPAFPGDDGQIDPVLAEVVGGELVELLSRYGTARVFVPVVAVLTSDPQTALIEGDKGADMAAVLMTGADGRQALLTFTSVEAMQRWNPQARPVPVYGRDAARSARAEGATALLLDLGSPGFRVIETADLEHIADEDVLVRTENGTAWVSPGR